MAAVLALLVASAVLVSPAAAITGSITMGVTCYSDPEVVSISNNTDEALDLSGSTLTSVNDPRANEPFALSGTLAPGEDVVFQFGTGATGNVLTEQFVFDNEAADEGAFLATPHGNLFALCTEGFAELVVGTAPPPGGDGTATVTIHKAVCYEGVVDADAECHANGLGGVAFAVQGELGQTDAAGVATFAVVAGSVTVTEDPAVVAQHLRVWVYCSERTSGAVLVNADGAGPDAAVTFAVAAGDEVVCDYYNIAPAVDDGDDDGDGGTDGGTTGGGTTGGTTALPNTGAGIGRGQDGGALPLLALAALGLGGAAVGLRRRPAA